jgi:hypothetical protein
MFGIQKSGRTWWIRETLIVLAALLLGLLFVTRVDASEAPVSRKMARQIDVMERIIDQVLIDSPNFLVHGRDNARGLFLEEFGVLFTFDASLVRGKGEDYSKLFQKWEKGFRIEKDDEGKTVLVIPDFSADEEDLEEAEEVAEGVRSWREREADRENRLYLRGKAEMVDVLLDYGDTVTTLDDDRWVAIVAYLRDSALFEVEDFSKLILKAKVGDLRKYASEEISEEEMIKRIVETEY